VIELRNVSGSYTGGSPVIADVSLRLEEAEICAILGANGAGKSTLLRAIMGLLPHVSGSIVGPGGKAIDRLPTYRIAREGIAYVPEGRGILYSLDVRENLLVGATPLLARDPTRLASRLARVLELFPILRERSDQRAGSLSGGQQQMLAIARALVSEPRVMLLDEPSLGLAPLVKRDIAELLTHIRETERIAILLVEQDIKTAQRCVGRAMILRQGRIVDELSIEALADSERLRHAYLGMGKMPA
jgi:branched-chain amino acid transport system ATP-binding protein